jgi:hypothetical protein
VIGFGVASESGFGSAGRLQEVEINTFVYLDRCNDLHHGDIVAFMHYAGVPDSGGGSNP